MTKLLSISDHATPTGFGRIADETMKRLARRGWDVFAAGLWYDGLLPPMYEGERLPYWVAALAGKQWLEEAVKLIGVVQPDVVVVMQDAPYADALWNAPVDWSMHALVVVTPVDGVPVYPKWVQTVKAADAALTISQFGVEAFRQAGARVGLLRPAADGGVFYRMGDDERSALRAKVGLTGAYVVGTMAQNQGRKSIPAMLTAFYRFAQDKPEARYLLDMEATSPAGWDIPALCEQNGWDARRLVFRADLARHGLNLRERYNLLDWHMVISHREGFGIPLVEAQACGVVSAALDYCSGREICGDDRGVLVPPIPYTQHGTWGGALDHFADIDQLVRRMEHDYAYPLERLARAERGMNAARAWTWDMAADVVDETVKGVMAKRKGAAA